MASVAGDCSLGCFRFNYLFRCYMSEVDAIVENDFPDTLYVSANWDMESIPDLTRDNFMFLVEDHNKLVCVIKKLQRALEDIKQ